VKHFFEQMFFSPKWYHYPLILILLPLSLIYGIFMSLRRLLITKKDFGIPIVSVGNLIVGGSGKTPFVIAIASRFEDVCVVSRGYGRQSEGLLEVSRRGEIYVDVKKSGDEPMLMAASLPHASVIVSEDRHQGIELAKKQGAKLIILDDGFNRVDIEKFEILLEPEEIQNYYTFPSGPFREFFSQRKYADIIAREGKDFTRHVMLQDAVEKMILVTAISNPVRLDRYLPEGVVEKVYLEDHAYFDEQTLAALLEKHQANSLLCTSKDRVKMAGFKLPISEMKLKLEIKNEIFIKIKNYIEGYRSEK
jgi:tetraacyldisaccharide 4'-kinase